MFSHCTILQFVLTCQNILGRPSNRFSQYLAIAENSEQHHIAIKTFPCPSLYLSVLSASPPVYLYLSVYLSVYSLPVYISVCLSVLSIVCLSICVCLYLSVYFLFVYVCLSICLCPTVSLCMSVSICLYMSFCLCLSVSVHPSVCLCLSVSFLSICYRSVLLSVYLSVWTIAFQQQSAMLRHLRWLVRLLMFHQTAVWHRLLTRSGHTLCNVYRKSGRVKTVTTPCYACCTVTCVTVTRCYNCCYSNNNNNALLHIVVIVTHVVTQLLWHITTAVVTETRC